METENGLTLAQILQAIRPTQQTASPANGATIVVNDPGTDVDLWLTPAGTLATLTITLPTGFQGMRVNIASNQAITLLTINGASSIFNPLNTLSIGDSFEMVKVGANTWVHPE